MSQVSTCLEEQLHTQVAHEVQDGDRLKNKSSLVLNHIKNGMVHLLTFFEEGLGQGCCMTMVENAK